jgi:lipocalin
MNIKLIIMIKKFLPMIFMVASVNSAGQMRPSVVADVDLNRYAGTWYEIARLPNSFERNMKCITATYTLRKDGKISVVNRGHRIDDPSRILSASGIARVPDKNFPGKLKVTFFWPFNGPYWIIKLDENYRHVLVGGPSLRYLWVLSRDKTMEEAVLKEYLGKAAAEGFDTGKIIMVEHDCN